jgi:sugar-specific transcriptional regulator TrmB
MNFTTFFTQLGFNQKETNIFLTLYKLGSSPASTIAKHLAMERTNVYKTLLKMADEGVVLTTQHQGVKHFFVPDITILKKYLNNKKEQMQHLEDNFGLIENELSQYDQKKYSYIPKISLFD